MTTPERLRRRQMIEGTLLVILGLVVTANALYGRHEDVLQRDCITQQVTGLTSSLTARGQLTQRDSDATRAVILSVAQAETETDVRKALDDYIKTQHQISTERADHPVPPFPTGSCG